VILAIETATQVCSVAVKDRQGQIFEERTHEYGQHAERLFRYIETLRDEIGLEIRDLSACLISEGPGSYTGLRIGASGVKGLLYGTDIPLFAVNTLAAMGWGVHSEVSEPALVHATIDARRSHLYHQLFQIDQGQITSRTPAELSEIQKLNDRIERGSYLVGTGWDRLDEELLAKITAFGLEKISARNLIDFYEMKGGKDKLPLPEKGQEDLLIRRVNPAEFDPKYITSKKPGT
jgi:tRNA threonylcarbamoyl adenosine modification protein YeaZ